MSAPSVPDLEAARKRPSYICEQCWTSVIANQLGLLLPPSEQAPSSELEWNTDPTSKYVYSVSEADIRAADKQGCRWCHLIVQFASFRSQFDDEGDSKPPSDNIVEIRVGRGGPERDVLDITVNDELCWFGYVYTTEHDPAASLLPARNLVCEVGSDKALSLVTDLVNDCCSNHHDCPPVSKPYLPLPTRVIDCSDPSKPRLFISNERRDRYIALSYVWGEDQPYKTTTDNIDSYTASINVDILPPTILDAIKVTHKMGVRYLWIDSLCIIQNSDADKDHEISRMRNVYRDAYLTIIAASANRVGEGFLQTRTDFLGKEAIELPFVLPDSNVMGLLYLSSWMMTTQQYDPSREPLHQRGWCMQEYFLSPRELIFATHTLQYRCQKHTQNIGGASNPYWISSEHDPAPLHDLPKSPQTREETEKVRQAWKATIENYTKRSLSLSTDKFVALASLAEEFSEITESPYLAGFWEQTLLPDLLWSKDQDRYYTPRPKEYRAPSWSWAAVDGEVNGGNAYFLSDKQQLISKLIRCETVPKTPKIPFGEVISGALVICAPVMFDCVMMPHWMVYRLLEVDEGGHDMLIDQKTGRRKQEMGRGELDSSDDDDFTDGVQRISVVLIYSRFENNVPGSDVSDRVIQGLLVEQLGHRNDPSGVKMHGKYRRIGFFEGTVRWGEHDWLEEIRDMEIELV